MHEGRVNGSLNLSRALGDMEFKRGEQLPPAEQVGCHLPCDTSGSAPDGRHRFTWLPQLLIRRSLGHRLLRYFRWLAASLYARVLSVIHSEVVDMLQPQRVLSFS